MPSRAVVRKKARREVKKQKEAVRSTTRSAIRYNGSAEEARMQAARSAPASSQHTGPTVVPAQFQLPPPPRRPAKAMPRVVLKAPAPPTGENEEEARGPVGEPAAEVGAEEVLTHKQRKKLQTKLRLEKQMSRLQVNSARAAAAAAAATVAAVAADAPAETAGGEEAESRSSSGADDGAAPAATAVVLALPKERHDPRFTNGTFWRDRKERRGRTLFLGGVPSHFTLAHIKDFVTTVVDSDPGAVEYIAQLPEGTPILEEVDMLPDKHGGKVRHMYIVMASVPIAFIASTKLDGMRMDQRCLRCNFAADKTQRTEAIKRRGPEVGVGSGGGDFGGGRGFGGPRGGGGRGGCRGGGGRSGGRGFSRGGAGSMGTSE